ncbi:MAG: hypothetical protein ABI619_00115 [Betaproteobacteria bacterium]
MKGNFPILLLICSTLPWGATHSAQPLGRLFFTPTQRETLDAGKHLATANRKKLGGPRTATLNGVVTRSDGESTVWVNGTKVVGNGASGVNASVSDTDPAAARVKLRGTRQSIRLKVGQRFDRSTGKITEPYASRPVEAELPAPNVRQQERAVQAPSGGVSPAQPTENGDNSTKD